MRAVLLYVLTPYLAVTAIMVVFQRRLIFQPTKTERLLAKDVAAPSAVEDVQITAANGLVLHGWRYRAAAVGADEAKMLVIYFPGNAGCRRDRVGDCCELTQLGCDVLLFDYRGYGDNGGSPGEEVMASDARRVWLVATRILHFPSERIVLFGESMGGAVATRLAAEFSLIGDPPAALILNSTFTSLPDVAAWHYPVFPFRFLLIDRFPSIKRIPHVTSPILQFHGTADDIVPFELGRRLFEAAPNASATGVAKQFVAIEGGRHNFITMRDLQAAVGKLLTEIRAQKSGSASGRDE